jgi:hypothetical protein
MYRLVASVFALSFTWTNASSVNAQSVDIGENQS